MTMKKNLASLSKGTKSTTKKTSTRGRKTTTTTKKQEESNNRDLKAKETVNKLLDEVPLINKKEENENVDNKEIKKGTDWLEEQLQTLVDKNENLEKEVITAKENYKKIFDDYQKLKKEKNNQVSPEKTKVLQLFNELQDNYGKLGQNFKVYFPAFLNRMVMFFPFLSNHKKY